MAGSRKPVDAPARLRGATSRPAAGSGPVPSEPDPAPEPEKSSEKPADRDRLNAPLKENGHFAVSRMHPKNRAALVKALDDPELFKELGLVKPGDQAPAAGPGQLSVALAEQSILLLMVTRALILERLEYSKEIIREVAPLRESTQKAVTELLPRILHRRLGKYLDRFDDEATLGLILAGDFFADLNRARELQSKERRTVVPIRAVDPAPAAGPATIEQIDPAVP